MLWFSYRDAGKRYFLHLLDQRATLYRQLIGLGSQRMQFGRSYARLWVQQEWGLYSLPVAKFSRAESLAQSMPVDRQTDQLNSFVAALSPWAAGGGGTKWLNWHQFTAVGGNNRAPGQGSWLPLTLWTDEAAALHRVTHSSPVASGNPQEVDCPNRKKAGGSSLRAVRCCSNSPAARLPVGVPSSLERPDSGSTWISPSPEDPAKSQAQILTGSTAPHSGPSWASHCADSPILK